MAKRRRRRSFRQLVFTQRKFRPYVIAIGRSYFVLERLARDVGSFFLDCVRGRIPIAHGDLAVCSE
jgi:hypothetical protein